MYRLAIVATTALVCIFGLLACTTDSPQAVTAPRNMDPVLLTAMKKEFGSDLVDLGNENVEDLWTYQMNETYAGKKCGLLADVADISRTKDGYLLHGESSHNDVTRTWKLRLQVDDQVANGFQRRYHQGTVTIIIDQAEFSVIESATKSRDSAVLMTGRVLALVQDNTPSNEPKETTTGQPKSVH